MGCEPIRPRAHRSPSRRDGRGRSWSCGDDRPEATRPRDTPPRRAGRLGDRRTDPVDGSSELDEGADRHRSSPRSRPPPGPRRARHRRQPTDGCRRACRPPVRSGRRNRTGRRADHVAGTATDPEAAIGVDRPDIAGGVPAVGRGGEVGRVPQTVVAEPLMGGPYPDPPSTPGSVVGRPVGTPSSSSGSIRSSTPSTGDPTHTEVVERAGTERLQRDQVDVGDRQTFGHAVGRAPPRRNQSIDCGPQHMAGHRRTGRKEKTDMVERRAVAVIEFVERFEHAQDRRGEANTSEASTASTASRRVAAVRVPGELTSMSGTVEGRPIAGPYSANGANAATRESSAEMSYCSTRVRIWASIRAALYRTPSTGRSLLT